MGEPAVVNRQAPSTCAWCEASTYGMCGVCRAWVCIDCTMLAFEGERILCKSCFRQFVAERSRTKLQQIESAPPWRRMFWKAGIAFYRPIARARSRRALRQADPRRPRHLQSRSEQPAESRSVSSRQGQDDD